MANLLIQRKYIKLGLGYSTIERKMYVKRCFRCWEHLAKDCKETDRTGLCQKCGEQGHKAKECNEERGILLIVPERGAQCWKDKMREVQRSTKNARDAEKSIPQNTK